MPGFLIYQTLPTPNPHWPDAEPAYSNPAVTTADRDGNERCRLIPEAERTPRPPGSQATTARTTASIRLEASGNSWPMCLQAPSTLLVSRGPVPYRILHPCNEW